MTALKSSLVVLVLTLATGSACTRPLIEPGSPDADPASPDPGPGSPDAGSDVTPVVDRAALEREVMARWNAVADGRAAAVNSHWSAFEQFPHPTFKFGTAEAYGEFAEVLIAFLERDDNFDFLVRNDLFEMRLRNVLASGQVGIDTSFEELILYFSSDTAFGDIAIETRARLRACAERLPD